MNQNEFVRSETQFPKDMPLRTFVSFIARKKTKPSADEFKTLETVGESWKTWKRIITIAAAFQLVVSTLHRVQDLHLELWETSFLFVSIVFLSGQTEYAFWKINSQIHKFSGNQLQAAWRVQNWCVGVMVVSFMSNIIYFSGLRNNALFSWLFNLYTIYLQNAAIVFLPITQKILVLNDRDRELARQNVEQWHRVQTLQYQIGVSMIDALESELENRYDEIGQEEINYALMEMRRNGEYFSDDTKRDAPPTRTNDTIPRPVEVRPSVELESVSVRPAINIPSVSELVAEIADTKADNGQYLDGCKNCGEDTGGRMWCSDKCRKAFSRRNADKKMDTLTKHAQNAVYADMHTSADGVGGTTYE